MNNFQLINHIQTAVALIDKNLTVVEANNAFHKRNNLENSHVVGTKCFNAAYSFNENCSNQSTRACPVKESFKTKKCASAVHHFWIDNHAVVEEITTTPIIEENGDVNYVIEEFRDVSELLGLKKGIINVCSYCRKIKDSDGQWIMFEAYLQKHTGADFSHGVCEGCHDSLFDNFKNKVSHSHHAEIKCDR